MESNNSTLVHVSLKGVSFYYNRVTDKVYQDEEGINLVKESMFEPEELDDMKHQAKLNSLKQSYGAGTYTENKPKPGE